MRALAVLLLAASAFAQPGKSVHLEELTWTEVRDAIQAGKTTLIVPTGGTEQNGPHMVLGKHNFRIRHIAGRVAATLGNALVAPVMAYVPEGAIDPPEGHMKFPGTITLPDEYFRRVLEFTARSARLHGFKNIVFIGDSGPNQPGMQAVAAQLNTEWAGSGVRLHFIPEHYRGNGFEEWLLSQGETKESIGTHAGVQDTSLLLAVDPKLIRKDKISKGPGAPGSGVTGDPSRATLAYGRKGLDMIVDIDVRRIRESIAAPPAPPAPASLSPAEQRFQDSLTNVTLTGYFTNGDGGELKQDRYIIDKVSKATGKLWRFDVRIPMNGRLTAIALPIPIEWAGDTAVVTLTDNPVPGMGRFSARVLFYGDSYAGTWSGGDHGGKMFGAIRKN